MIRVKVHRQPVLEKERGRWVRTKKILETKEVLAEAIFGHGIDVYFPLNNVRTFSMATGVGRGLMRDWVIDPKDLVLLLAKKDKPSVVPPPSNG
jgi:hypothetical protein